MLRMYKQRANYWSCSKFADWILNTFAGRSKIKSGTAEEWSDWRKTMRAEHPLTHWFVEEALDNIQNFLYWPYDVVDAIRTYYHNRFVTKTHYAPTRLEPGVWHETDQRMMHSMFELLVDFVEIEKAHMQLWTAESKNQDPWWHKIRLFRWKEFRSRELGLKHLEWEMTLDQPNVDEWGTDQSCPRQAIVARELQELYTWWKDVRPNRPDPMDVSGWSDYCDSRRSEDPGDVFAALRADKTDEERTASRNIFDKMNEIEEAYDKEDEDMMIRLIRVRRSLWT